jgi:hypothetical protein
MILIDLNQVIIASLMATSRSMEIDESLARHVTLNTILTYKKKFGSQYGDIVICCDSRNSWRRTYFPYYKAHRKKDQEDSAYDWNMIFNSLSKIRSELKENFPYRVIEVDGAEADDIIGTLVEHYHDEEDIVILSSDKDFMQLQKYRGVVQYSPYHGKFLNCDDPESFLREHIIKGDKGDGIPNMLSEDGSIVLKIRQKTLTAGIMSKYKSCLEAQILSDVAAQRGYARNRQLIDLRCTPDDIKKEIINSYETATPSKGGQCLFSYFVEHKLKNLMNDIGDF